MADYDADVARSHTDAGRAIMRVLTERGHYEETPDAFEWAQVDAGVAVRYMEERGQTIRNLWDALDHTGTGLHDTSFSCGYPEQTACLKADVEAIVAALTGQIGANE